MREYDDARKPDAYGEAELKRMIEEIRASQQALREDRERLLNENARLVHLVETQRNENIQLREDIAGYQQIQNTTEAVMEALVRHYAPTQENPICLSQEAVNAILTDGTKISIDYDAETQMWKLYMKEKEQGEE